MKQIRKIIKPNSNDVIEFIVVLFTFVSPYDCIGVMLVRFYLVVKCFLANVNEVIIVKYIKKSVHFRTLFLKVHYLL